MWVQEHNALNFERDIYSKRLDDTGKILLARFAHVLTTLPASTKTIPSSTKSTNKVADDNGNGSDNDDNDDDDDDNDDNDDDNADSNSDYVPEDISMKNDQEDLNLKRKKNFWSFDEERELAFLMRKTPKKPTKNSETNQWTAIVKKVYHYYY